MPRYYDRWGLPIDRDEWATRFEDDDYKRVGDTLIDKRWRVSTIWLGLDHGYGYMDGAPLIFETCVFDHHDIREVDIWGHHDVYHQSYGPWRYVTLEQARKAHRRIVRHIQKGGHPEDI